MGSLILIILMIINVAWFIVLAHVIMSWLLNFQILNMGQPLVRQVWYGLEGLLDPIYRRIRSVLPAMGGLDLAPLVFLIGLWALEVVIRRNAGAMM